VEKHRETGRSYAFPKAVEYMKKEGRLLKTFPPVPPFHSGMNQDEFINFMRELTITVDPILPSAQTYMTDPTMEEEELFPEGKDVFCLMNMPYMVDILHLHNYFEITHVLKGSCTFLFGNEKVTLTEGEICIVSPMSGHSLPLEPGCFAVAVTVRRSTFDTVFSNLLAQKDLLSLFFRNNLYESKRANYILLKTGNDSLTNEAMQQLIYECNVRDEYANDCAVNLLNLYLARALRASKSEITLHHYEGYSERDFDFSLMIQYIQHNYRTVTLATLAQEFHFSETYLSKLIHKKMNQSFTEMLRTLKMNHAMEYLMNTSLKVSEIADAVGYDSVDHFSRTFRKIYGVPPQEYKKRVRPAGATKLDDLYLYD
jgi:AraC-like DNA-binding protein/mannose-6-phosphate isomerase-like protein (cupin superfamily)